MKYIIIIIVIIFIFSIFLFGNTYEKQIKEYLKEKYQEEFTYIDEIDRDVGGSWSTHHLKSQNGDNIIVQYVKKGKIFRDNYYKILKKNDIILYISNKLKSSINLSNINDYKYYFDNNSSYCDNRINKNTKLEDAFNIPDCELIKFIYIYISEDTPISIVSDASFKYFEDLNITIKIIKVSNNDYNMLNSDNNKYIYDYDKYNSIKENIIYKSK